MSILKKRTYSRPDHIELADQRQVYLGHNIGHYNIRPDKPAAGHHSSHLLADMDCWHLHCNSPF